MSEQVERNNTKSKGDPLVAGLALFVMGSALSLSGVTVYVEHSAPVVVLIGFGVLAFPFLFLGLSLSVLSAAKIEK